MRFRSSATDRYDRAEAMGRESISRLLLRFSGPAIIASETAASFGVVPLAVLGVLFKVNHLVFGVCMGIGQGMLPLVGYNFGAKKKERVGEVVLKAGLTSFIWGAVSWVFVSLFSAQIVSLFGTDPSFLSEGAFALRILALGFFTVGVQNNLSFFFQGIGKALPSLVVASCRQLLFLTPCLLAMPKIFGLTGLWAAYPVADALSLLLTLSWAVRTFRNLQIPLHIFSVSQQASTEPKGSA